MPSRPPPPALLPWARAALRLRDDDAPAAALAVVAGDASSRRYFRLAAGADSYVLAEAPPQTQDNRAFCRARDLLADAGVRVPAVHAADFERGFLLLEDLGGRPLLPELDATSAPRHYRAAFDILLRMAAVDTAASGLPRYDRTLLEEELSRFPTWFAGGLLGLAPDAAAAGLFQALCRRLVDSALAQPVVLVHRDFHSRNLMLLPGDALVVIDFQDAVAGPLTYDLVSLLRDCYIRWPAAQVSAWALAYRRLLLEEGHTGVPDAQQFLRWCDWLGLQRHLKVLGTFARLHLRDGKSGYLADLPLVLHYTREILARYAGEEPAFDEFARWFAARLDPLIARQPWGAAA